MAKILVHITHGPKHPTRAALAFLVVKSATEMASVSLFLAGDAVLDNLVGLGTGKLRELYDAIVAGDGKFYLSGISTKDRGVTDADLNGKPAEFAMHHVLIKLSLEHDRMFPY
jgi:uncharacterized protein